MYLSRRLVRDELRESAGPLLPSLYSTRPPGGGTAPVDERAMCTAVVYVLTGGRAWRHLPKIFEASPAEARRRCTAWAEATQEWRQPHRKVLDGLGSGCPPDALGAGTAGAAPAASSAPPSTSPDCENAPSSRASAAPGSTPASGSVTPLVSGSVTPLEGRAVALVAVRPPPPHRAIRAQGPAVRLQA
ncbi:transposase [Streptomyces sp. MNP-20]|uniref:transposase n=1 Tax=Streptomyces sp. MNP-20 TaxID=2721165 RepID=UPI0035C7D47D